MPSFLFILFFKFAFHRHGEELAQIGVREGLFGFAFCKCGGWKCLFRRCGGASQVVCVYGGGGGGGGGGWVCGCVCRWVGGLVGRWVSGWVCLAVVTDTHLLTPQSYSSSHAHACARSLSHARAPTRTHTQCQGPRAYGLKSR
jgi:hypothetical protein